MNSARKAKGIKIDWAYAPGATKVLVSADGANYEEAKGFSHSGRDDESFVQYLMFDKDYDVKVARIVMSEPQTQLVLATCILMGHVHLLPCVGDSTE